MLPVILCNESIAHMHLCLYKVICTSTVLSQTSLLCKEPVSIMYRTYICIQKISTQACLHAGGVFLRSTIASSKVSTQLLYTVDNIAAIPKNIKGCHRRFLNQVCTWFLKIISVQTFVCVCLPLRLLITSGVMWRDMDPMRLVKQFYSGHMVAEVVIVNGRGP